MIVNMDSGSPPKWGASSGARLRTGNVVANVDVANVSEDRFEGMAVLVALN
jgi:hypothetical protein